MFFLSIFPEVENSNYPLIKHRRPKEIKLVEVNHKPLLTGIK